jgi:MraZ protein
VNRLQNHYLFQDEKTDMFLGKYHSTIDHQNRLHIPSGISSAISGNVILTQGFDQNLWVLGQEAFEEVYRKITSLNLADPLARALMRMVLGGASSLDLGQTGEILIPDALRKFALLEDEAIIVGQGDYFEIWSPKVWDQQEAYLQDVSVSADRFAVLDLSRV